MSIEARNKTLQDFREKKKSKHEKIMISIKEK